jgi:trk system potassium uptake protein TrkH
MKAWQALNHGLTLAATGGFTIRDDSFASYGSAVRWIAVGGTLLAAVSFQIHHALLARRKWGVARRSTQLRLFLTVVAGGTLATFVLVSRRNPTLSPSDAVFDWISAIGTSGFTVNASHQTWSSGPLMLLTLAMIGGGCSGSTAGGLKQERLAWLLKNAWARLRRPDSPTSDCSFSFDGNPVDDATNRISEAASVAVIWLATMGLATLSLSLAIPEAQSMRILFDVTSALGGVGLDAGFISGEQPLWVLALFVGLMWMGRLELLAVFVLLAARARVAAREGSEQ